MIAQSGRSTRSLHILQLAFLIRLDEAANLLDPLVRLIGSLPTQDALLALAVPRGQFERVLDVYKYKGETSETLKGQGGRRIEKTRTGRISKNH